MFKEKKLIFKKYDLSKININTNFTSVNVCVHVFFFIPSIIGGKFRKN